MLLRYDLLKIVLKIDKQWGPTVLAEELCLIFFNNLNGKGIWKRIVIYVCITESLCYTPKSQHCKSNIK